APRTQLLLLADDAVERADRDRLAEVVSALLDAARRERPEPRVYAVVGHRISGWEPLSATASRLRRQYLDHRVPAGSIAQVVGDLCGLHAQLLSSAELALWARVQGLALGDLSDALWKSRILVRTWAMRGTLHVLPAADYALWQAGLGTYDHYLKNAWSTSCRRLTST
ncbi:MAG: winged helix DNA-binding domain-containing protein, partial [Actinobacteria bacterium]|nr:winged helix DNA-binding domain-containing protein [Actinomycetota bacterium]